MLASPISAKEIEIGIEGLSKGASPGLDGITTDFVQFFKPMFTKILHWL